jgi:hypothetical protein
MTIEVTQQHIDEGSRSLCASCPIALAIKAVGFRNVSVGSGTVQIGDCFAHLLPPAVRDFIQNHDNIRPVRPFSFEIDLPEMKH